jgi:hypothetical protein
MTTSYITNLSLNQFLIDSATGQPLANGYIQFFQDTNRTVGKVVYQKVPFSPPQYNNAGNEIYNFVSMGDVLTLSSVGTIVDNNNNQVNFYYFPYDVNGNLSLYFVQIYNSLGVLQKSLEGFPDTFETENPGASSNGNSDNQISNPQFSVVNFNGSTTISLTGSGTSTVPIAPDWNLVIGYSGTGSVVVTQNAIAGRTNIVTNPPYSLTLAPSGNISSLSLVQTLNSNPGIWAGSYLATNFVLGASAPTTTVTFTPSTGTATTLLSTNNPNGTSTQFSDTVLLPASNNTSAPPTGNSTIVITFSTTLSTTITSIQVLSVAGNITGVVYEQESVNRQVDHLFNYYNALLQYKPIPSYLVGWDFPLNPAQFFNSASWPMTLGAINKSAYLWDQTILFQSVDASITATRDTSGALKTLANISGQLALVQYIPAPQAIEMLSRRKCVNVSANASVATVATVSLWYTKTTLPSTIGSKNSLVLTLDANGYPNTQNGTWVQVPRSGQGTSTLTSTATNAALINIATAPSGAANFNQYPLNGWDMQGNTDINGATYFAIVVGTAVLPLNAYVLWQSISCQDGDIATVPAPKSQSSTLQDCQQYYWKTFPISPVNVPPATGAGVVGAIALSSDSGFYDGANNIALAFSVPVQFPVVMASIPNMVYYNTTNANAKWYRNGGTPGDSGTASSRTTISTRGVDVLNPLAGGTESTQLNGYWTVHATADSRLGQ